jgi:hypothetical protein
MKTVSLHQILAYYDGPQVVEARDTIGGHYVGLAIDDANFEFLIVGASPERLRQFRGGTIDLLALITDRPVDIGWQLAKCSDGDASTLGLSDLSWDPIRADFLPDAGFVLRSSQAVADLVKEARERNGLVMEVTLDPPEAIEHRINSDTLGQFLLVFQRMLKHAFKAWIREQPAGQFSPTGYTFAVAGLKAGSVRIELQPEQTANLFGAGESKPAVETVLRMIASADDPETAVLEVTKNRGHLASAFVSLLDVLIESQTRIQVDWADGLSDTVASASLSQDQAQKTRTRLAMVSELEGEQRIITGVLKKADVNRGTWRLQTNEDSFSGQCLDDGPSLSHVEIDSSYQFTCTERIELSPSGRERSVLYLQSLTKV